MLTVIVCYRSEYDGDLQSQLLSKANEEDKNCSRALSVVSVVVRAAKDLLHRAFAVDGEGHFLRFPQILSRLPFVAQKHSPSPPSHYLLRSF